MISGRISGTKIFNYIIWKTTAFYYFVDVETFGHHSFFPTYKSFSHSSCKLMSSPILYIVAR